MLYHIRITETYHPWWSFGLATRTKTFILTKDCSAKEAWDFMAELRMQAMYNSHITVEMVDDDPQEAG